jgi:hypothetical protein
MNITNNKGPKTLPCGTPDRTSAKLENFPFKTTLCRLLDSQLLTHIKLNPGWWKGRAEQQHSGNDFNRLGIYCTFSLPRYPVLPEIIFRQERGQVVFCKIYFETRFVCLLKISHNPRLPAVSWSPCSLTCGQQ